MKIPIRAAQNKQKLHQFDMPVLDQYIYAAILPNQPLCTAERFTDLGKLNFQMVVPF
jgi:hypothetical protein